MALPTTLADDYKIAAYDGGQTVTFRAIRSGATTAYSCPYSDDHDLAINEVASSAGLYQMGDKRWTIGAALITVAADRPQPGDTITDAASVVWHITDAAVLDDLGISWVCNTRKAR